MHFVSDTIPGEIMLMFVSYLLFCTVLMYLFVRTDREWGRMEVSLDLPVKKAIEAPLAPAMWMVAESDNEPMPAKVSLGQNLSECAEHHALDCTCFLTQQGRRKDAA